MICPYCGGEHPEGAGFCPKTGRPLSPAGTCPHCGQMHPAGAQFCPITGKELIPGQVVSRPRKGIWIWIGGFALFVCTGLLVGLFFLRSELSTSLIALPLPWNNQDVTPIVQIVATEHPTATNDATLPPTVAAISLPSATVRPVITRTDVPPTATEEVVEPVNEKDGAVLVLVPEGEFTMGSDAGKDPYFWGAEGPSHFVNVSSYYIYKTEVTNGLYQVCVEEKGCPKPGVNNSRTIKDYYGNPTYNAYPVMMVSWMHADAYCKWAGGRLPTEAEWEKAARGEDGRLFPWGNDPVSGSLVNYCDQNCPIGGRDGSVNDGYPDTSPVGSFPDGASPYGVLDMAGNVWEWVRDYFVPEYYKISPLDNPLGPASGSRRTIRGGSWFNPLDGIRTVVRASLKSDSTLDTVGFRCVVEIP